MTALQSNGAVAVCHREPVRLCAPECCAIRAFLNSIVVIAVLCLILIEAPRDVTLQLASDRLPAATGVIARWLLVVAGLGAVNLLAGILQELPRRVIWSWVLVTPFALVGATLLVQAMMRRVLLRASGHRTAIFAGYNEGSLMLAHRIRDNPVLCLKVEGFFDDRSADRLGAETDPELKGPLSELVGYVNNQHIDVIFIALPIVMCSAS